MKRKKSVKKLKPFNLEYEVRGLGVMMEHMGDQIKLIAEQHGDIVKTLHSHTVMIGHMQEEIKNIQVDMAMTRSDIEIMKADMEFIKHGLKRKVDTEEFATLERRVALLERKR